MTRSTYFAAAALTISSISLLPAFRTVQAAPAGTAQNGQSTSFIGHHYEGMINAIAPSEGSVTITTRYGMKLLTIKITPATKIWKTVASTPDQLTVGAKIMAIGREGADKNTMQVGAVDILPDFPPKVILNPPKDHRNELYGTVTTVTPTITVTDLSGVTITLQTNNGRFLTGATVLGDFTDFELDTPIKADGDIVGGVLNASAVFIAPGDMQAIRRNKGAGKNRPARPIPPPAASPAAPAKATPPAQSVSGAVGQNTRLLA